MVNLLLNACRSAESGNSPIEHQWKHTMKNTKTDRLIQLDEVKSMTSLSRSTIYQKMSMGDFPESVSLSNRCTRWSQNELQEWVEKMKSNRSKNRILQQ